MRRFSSSVLVVIFVPLLCVLASCSSTSEPEPMPVEPPPPAAAAPPDRGPAGDPGMTLDIRASRLFARPGQYPPQDFAAYGIIAFRAAATAESSDRYKAICVGFSAGLPAAAELVERGIPIEEQMATVWPLKDGDLAHYLNKYSSDSGLQGDCPAIIASIDIVTSRNAILKAERALGGQRLSGEGPYLLAWSPSATFGKPDALVLMWDLSDVTNSTQATRMFSDWAVEIEKNPQLWSQGWNLDKVRIKLRLWADKYGAGVLEMLGLGT